MYVQYVSIEIWITLLHVHVSGIQWYSVKSVYTCTCIYSRFKEIHNHMHDIVHRQSTINQGNGVEMCEINFSGEIPAKLADTVEKTWVYFHSINLSLSLSFNSATLGSAVVLLAKKRCPRDGSTREVTERKRGTISHTNTAKLCAWHTIPSGNT